jgi:hypothetical protein
LTSEHDEGDKTLSLCVLLVFGISFYYDNFYDVWVTRRSPSHTAVSFQQRQARAKQATTATMASSNNNHGNSADHAATPDKILWSCIGRNEVILAEAGTEAFGGAVAATAQGLLRKKATAGWEYHSHGVNNPFARSSSKPPQQQPAPRLKGVKFHLLDPVDHTITWVFCAVYNPQAVALLPVQSFLEKIMGLTEFFREDDRAWRQGSTLAAQASFAPILLQRMEEVTYLGKMAMLSTQLEATTQIMANNIDHLLEREEKLDALAERGTRLEQMAGDFKRQTKGVRRRMMWQNARHGLLLGTAITAGVAIVVVPPLVAIL